MINVDLLNQHFTQQPNSCVLSSYAIVTNFFRNNVTLPEVFEEYCNYFRIPYTNLLESERHSSNHLNHICQQILNWRGYQMISYIHNQSINHLFNQNKSFFSANILSLNPLSNLQIENLINVLTDHESLANFLIQVQGGFHSQTLGKSETGALFIHNTALERGNNITYPTDFNFNSILECIIYERI